MQILRLEHAIGGMTNLPPVDMPPCCACGGMEHVHTIYMLDDVLAPVPGTGWGCQICGLDSNGALAVLCDTCYANKMPVREVVAGKLMDGRRAPIDNHRGSWSHQASNHHARPGWHEEW